MSTTLLTADLVARAVIAAAMSYGDDPASALDPKRRNDRRSVTAAASGLQRGLKLQMTVLESVLKVKATSVYAARRSEKPEFLKAEAALMAALGYAAWRPETRASVVKGSGSIATDNRVEPAKEIAAVFSESIAEARDRPSRMALPVARRQRHVAPRAVAVAPPTIARRIRPVSDDVQRYARWYLDARWPLSEVAHLFDVCPEELAATLDLGRAA